MAKQPTNPKNNNEINLRQLTDAVASKKKTILSIAVVGALLGLAYGISTDSEYRADAKLEIDTSNRNQVLNEISNMMSGSPNASPADAEIDLITSRLVLGKTVDDLHLDTAIEPQYTPIVGSLLHKLNRSADPELSLNTLDVPKNWLNKEFFIKIIDNNTYSITSPDDNTSEGKVGQLLKINNGVSVQIDQLLAEPGQKFAITQYSRLAAIQNINKNLSISTRSTSPIINMFYRGNDPENIQLILDSIINNYIHQNKNRNIQVAASGLAFISEELPRLKESLQDAERKLNDYRTRSGSVDIPTEAQNALRSLSDIESQITTLKTEEAGLAELYTKEHPSYKAVLDRISVLERTRNRVNQQIAAFPNTQQEVIRLTRDVDINQATYVQLLARQQELNILKASAQGNVRVIDEAAASEKPVNMGKGLLAIIAGLGTGILASAWFMLQSLLRQTISSREDLEAMGLNTFATIPLSLAQQKRNSLTNKTKQVKTSSANYLLANDNPTDMAVEAIRALRSNIYFSTLKAKNNIVMISGATPEVGKSFTSVNLSAVMAQSDKRILLIDADMRKGYLHKILNLNDGKGLSEVLADSIQLFSAIQPTSIPGLDFLSRGSVPNNPSELLLGEHFKEILKQAREQYDFVIIDTPPALVVTDASIIGQEAGSTLLVARADKTSPQELENCLVRLAGSNIDPTGIILNGVHYSAKESHAYEVYSNSKA